MTGIILAVFASVCVGKLTYRKASYWHPVASMLENAIALYAERGAAGPIVSPLATIPIRAIAMEVSLFQKFIISLPEIINWPVGSALELEMRLTGCT